MKIFLLPISVSSKPGSSRTLLYCQRLNTAKNENPSYFDKANTYVADKANNLWTSWEQKESGWQKKVVVYGNQALRRIPYEEWGLKSIPPLSKRREGEELSGKEKLEVSYPSTLIDDRTVLEVLKKLGTERKQLHRRLLIWSFVGMPLVAPFALVPIIPNLPFFYLVYRAWSHWRALGGAAHLEFLLKNDLLEPKPSKILDELYSNGRNPFVDPPSPNTTPASDNGPLEDDIIVLHKSDGKRIAEALKIPELETELDRAVWQVEKALNAKKELQEEKNELESSLGKDQIRK